ncbi:MAG TPA: hypothetical protein VK927_10750 [Adhaeribacter sp.]|nr:hypothetical protein [Adhaeribacter sp.]
MKNSAKVFPLSCRCKLSVLVPHLKQLADQHRASQNKRTRPVNLRGTESLFVRYI